MSMPLFDAQPETGVWTVSGLAKSIRDNLKELFPLIQVEGEIAGLRRVSSGHLYFTLKDESAIMTAAMWKTSAQRLRYEIEDGLQVVVTAEIDFYAPRGSLQLIVRSMEPKGIGSLELAFKQLRERLEAQGLFSVERKRAIPPFPKRVAVVTSINAAALRDFVEVALRRWNLTEIIVVPSLVQGDDAPKELIMALRRAEMIRPDVIALVRGGGSLEDLWAFNNEALAHAIFRSGIPIVCGVGHETDVTIADLVADVRALTPTEAAERIFPDRQAIARHTRQQALRLTNGALSLVAKAWQKWHWIARASCIREPLRNIRTQAQRLDDIERCLLVSLRRTVESTGSKVGGLERELAALSPKRVLERGYAIAIDETSRVALRDSTQTEPGRRLSIRLAHGSVVAEVESVQKENGD